MKRLLTVFTCLCVAYLANAQKDNVIIKASLPGIPDSEWVYYRGIRGNISDSVKPNENGFTISMFVKEGEGDLFIINIGKLRANTPPGKSLIIFLQKGVLKIKNNTPSFLDATITGGKDARYYNAYQNRDKLAGMRELTQKMQEARSKNDSISFNQLQEQYITLRKEQLELDKTWFVKNAATPAIAYTVFFDFQRDMPLSVQDSLLQLAKPSAKNNLIVKDKEHTIETDKRVGIGRPALDFSQDDTSGNKLALRDFRGKYVLVDFWASWCVPCRIQNPHVVTAYQLYKNKGFTVLGVSFDNPGKHDAWMQAIYDDQLTWNHVSDLKGWKNAAGQLYDIRSIPSNILVDPNGIIVGKNLRGEALDKKLHELLGEPKPDKGTFVINGRVTGVNGDTQFYLSYLGAEGKRLTDSVKLFSGAFVLTGKVDGPTQASMYFKSPDSGRVDYYNQRAIFLEPGVITIGGRGDSVQSLTVSGGPIHEEWTAFEKLNSAEKEIIKEMMVEYNNGNAAYIQAVKAGSSESELAKMKEGLEEIKNKMQPYQQKMRKGIMDYFRNNPSSYVTASQLKYYVSGMGLSELEEIYGKMNSELQESPDGKALAKEISQLRSGSPGSIATDFTDTDINGKTLSLSDFRGKYVLIDFWASWCVPCRKGNPHLLDLYAKYNKKGFEIIGVSDDDSKPDAWRKAVKEDKIGVWKHVLRGLKRTPDGDFDRSSDKTEAYAIHSLPTKILIDPKGVIIGRYGGGGENDAALDKKLQEIFK